MFLDLIEVLVYTIGINLSVSNIIYIYNIASYTSTFYKVIRTIIKYQYLFRYKTSTVKSKHKLEDIEMKELKKLQNYINEIEKNNILDDYEIINYQ